MSRKRRVFCIDDSVVVRRMLSDIIGADPNLEITGTAPSGPVAFAKLANLPVDVITLDVEMPEMSGLEVLVELKKRFPKIPVIMFSSLMEHAAATTLDALSRGATDYVTKPSMTGSREASLAHVRAQLLPKLHGLTMTKPPPMERPAPRKPPPRPAGAAIPDHPRAELIVIGSSTGGPNVIADLCKRFAPLSVPIVIVQHMPPVFTNLFAQRLSAECPTKFVEAAEGMVLAPGKGYVAPGDFHVKLVRGPTGIQILLDRGPPENSCRPAVDVMFRSAAALAGPRTLALVLTGMGQDGLVGAKAIKAAGGRVLAQDAASSVVWGMPGAVMREGVAEAALSIADLATELNQCTLPRSLRHVG